MAQADDVGEQTDDRLMHRIQRREAAALAEAANRHGQAIFAIAFRMLGDRAEAEDIAQEALVRLWTHAPRWQFGRPIRPWLRQVATNLAIDHIRRARRLTPDSPPERADPDAATDENMAHAEMRAIVAECIAALPERQRAAVILTYYEEQSNRQVADLLRMGIKAFESMLLRARHMLRACLAGHGVLASNGEGTVP
jgi:RNA polymerase sigma-70 factor (ECF subfamily)